MISTGEQFGRWTVIGLDGDGLRAMCRCSCGTEKLVWIRHLHTGRSRSCLPCSGTPLDLAGQRFGKLVAVRQLGRGKGGVRWLCECDCGNTLDVRAGQLRYKTRSCGCSRRHDLQVGQRFGALVVLALSPTKARHAMWRCRCDCGATAIVAGGKLQTGHTTSCGCKALKHGHWTGGKPSPTYTSWQAMWDRCTRKGHPAFNRYGGRGIGVCERWSDFPAFLADMGERPAGKTLDRIDNDRGYEPGNCRWATAEEQQGNRSTARLLTCGGHTRTVAEWSRAVGILASTISDRILRGWSVAEALSAPSATAKRRAITPPATRRCASSTMAAPAKAVAP